MKRAKKENKKKKNIKQRATNKNGFVLKSLKRLFVTVFFVAILVGGGLFLRTPQGQQFWQKTKDLLAESRYKAHLTLDQVPIQGHHYTKLEDISNALNVAQGMPILEIDLKEKRDALTRLPWIKDVVIERQLPNMLLVKIIEKKPIAIWQHKQKYSPIDEEGNPIADNKTIISNVLLVVGEDAPRYAPQLIKELEKYPAVRKQARSAVRVGNRRWDLYLNDVENGIVVRLPETDIARALERLQEFNDSNQILARDINVIDLKLPDRLIVGSETTFDSTKQKKQPPQKKKK